MLAKVCSAAVNGIEAYPVEVEVNAGYGDTIIVNVVNKTPKPWWSDFLNSLFASVLRMSASSPGVRPMGCPLQPSRERCLAPHFGGTRRVRSASDAISSIQRPRGISILRVWAE